MRLATLLLVASSGVHAAWLRWSVNQETVWAPQKTGHVAESSEFGWTPIPTPAPGVRSNGEVVLDLLKRQKSKTDWTNSETCGWFSGISSSAVLCGDGFTCATNSDHAVACASGTISPFYTACLDFSAFKAGSCSNLNPATGCCQREQEPACGTYIWTGSPERSMYKCFETASIISILDVPQFVVDASLFSKTHTTPKPTTTTDTLAETATGDSATQPNKTGGNDGGGDDAGGNDTGSGPADPAAGPATTTPAPGSSNNTPIIVGSVVGGIAGLLLLLLLLFCLRRKMKGKLGLGFTRNKKNKKEDNSNKAYHTMNLAAAGTKGRSSSGSETTTVLQVPSQQQQHQQQPQQYYHNQEQHHYLPQASTQPQFQPQQLNVQQHQHQPPQYQGPAVVQQQPPSVSYTVNGGVAHVPQPSYSQNTSYTAAPPTSSSSDAASRFVGGVVPIPYRSSENQQHEHPQPQPYYQQQPQLQPQFAPQSQQQLQPQPQFAPQSQQLPQLQPQFVAQPHQQQHQQQQQGIPSQVQPVNHIHLYYVPPTHQDGSTTTSQFSSPAPGMHTRAGSSAGVSTVPDALGLFVQQPEPTQAGNPSSSQDRGQDRKTKRDWSPPRERDNIPAYYGHSRDMSAVSSTSRRDGRSPSPDVDAEWLATRGPGYRQSM